MRTRLAVLAVALTAVGAAPAADIALTVLPRPAFPPPQRSFTPSGRTRLVLVSSRPRDPGLPTARPAPPPWAARRFGGGDLLDAVRQPGAVFHLYGRDGTSARFLVAASARTHRVRYAFDFGSFARPPRVRPGDADLVTEQVLWAREAGGVLTSRPRTRRTRRRATAATVTSRRSTSARRRRCGAAPRWWRTRRRSCSRPTHS